ncbi:MAG: hypothetical protein GKC05_02775 [Methanomicrobiales archaeon]|nr:hypothetical protein [Methanomicrobiales archaeon]NYT21649.1 hypothetical protein [Methanomicrobiales archaeon]
MEQRPTPVAPRVSDQGVFEEIVWLHGLMAESMPIRSAYYGVRDQVRGPQLVRYSAEKEGIYFQEPMQHQDYGITDEDLHEAVRQDALFAEHHGISRITPEISRKLQILYMI